MSNANVMKVFVLFGPPGSGKGTQAEMLTNQFKFAHVATGDLFRENIKNSTDLGRLAKGFMDQGKLVPDDVTISMLKERLTRQEQVLAYLLDGFPRTIPQAEALDGLLAGLNMKLDTVLSIHITDEEIVSRLSERYVCRGCQTPYNLSAKAPKKAGICDYCGGELYQRSDDNPVTVRARLHTYHQQTEPLKEFYRRKGLVREGDAMPGRHALFAQLSAVVKERLSLA